MFQILTSFSYWFLTILWTVILLFYLVGFRRIKGVDPTIAILILILAIDAFRTVFESAYFGFYFNSLYGFLPADFYDVLSKPQYVIIPKIINIAAGIIVLFIVIRRWMPRELMQHSKWLKKLQQSKDQTEQAYNKAANEVAKFEAIFNNISDAIVITDKERSITAINRGLTQMFGYTIDDLQGQKTAAIYESAEEFERQGSLRFNLSAEDMSKPYEVSYRRKNGEVFVGETVGTVIKSSDTEPMGFIGFIRDVSERNQSQLALKKALNKEEILVQEIHHRVKNNLQVILSMLSLQKRNATDEHEVSALGESSRRVHVMAKLYEHLYQSDNVSEIDAKQYFKEITRDALSTAGATDKVGLNVACDDLKLQIKVATACAQIISELVSNCLKHAFPDGEGNINVALHRLNEKELCLCISDDGVGLPDGFDEKKLKSMGIKLVNALVMQIRGTKQIVSEHGTTVTIKFPEESHV